MPKKAPKIVDKKPGKQTKTPALTRETTTLSPYESAMNRAALVIENEGGLPSGELQAQEKDHRSRWRDLVKEGATVRGQIIALKEQEV